MKKKVISIILAMTLALAMGIVLTGCGGGGSSDSTQEATEETTAKAEESKTFGLGETWEVPGQWKLTIDSVKPTDERNEFEDSDPAEVVVVKYHYENLGYEDKEGIMDGLFLELGSATIMDSEKNMCKSYAAPDVDEWAQETPVGGKCEAETAYGLKAKGNHITIIVDQYDGNGDKQKATFELDY